MATKYPLLDTNAAYNSIAVFFEAFSVVDARQQLQRFLLICMESRACKDDPSNVIYFYESLGELITAALVIQSNGVWKNEAIMDNEDAPDVADYKSYCGWQKKISPWEYMPRFLSRKEYANPYRVFKKLAKYSGTLQWLELLRELRDFTFSAQSITEEDTDHNILGIYLLLNKLLEAAHLINLRAIHEVDGKPLPKWEPTHDSKTEPPMQE